jgi:hypothetical protein
MAGEAAYTARLQLELACDLASIYGAPFDPEDLGDLATLFSLAFEVDLHQPKKEAENAEETAADAGLTAKLMSLEDGELAKRIGRKLLEESFMRNIVPIVGVAISARWNYVATRRFAAHAKRYARYRRALRHACETLNIAECEDPRLIIQGAWLLATVDGDAGHEELLALGLILDHAKIHEEELHLDEMGDDEEVWFDQLSRAPVHLHAPLLDVLYLVAATDRELAAPERRFLKRVGKAIGREIDFDRLTQFASHLGEGDELPMGFLRS